MSTTVQHLSLSALTPIQLSYNLQNQVKEELRGDYELYDQNLPAWNYNVLKNTKDALLSKGTVLVLTDIKDLKTVFDSSITNINTFFIAGNCYLKTEDPTSASEDLVSIRHYQNELYAGGKGKESVFTVFPLHSNKIRLMVEDKYVKFNSFYPYEVQLIDVIDYEQIEAYTFEVIIVENKIALQINTNEGKRFIACNKHDKKMRGTGLQLNSLSINQYLFDVEFLTSQINQYNFDPTSKEIKYFNSLNGETKQKTVDIKNQIQADTNLLLTIPIADFFKNEASANITILKTNFSAAGTFNSSI